MTLRELYFEWLTGCVFSDPRACMDYSMLLNYLDSVPFRFMLAMDENRYQDGIDIRYRFAYENGLLPAEIAEEIDIREPSVLEVMVSMAKRAEEHIMQNDLLGNRTELWFMSMLKSMHIDIFDDYSFENYEEEIKMRVEYMLDRNYSQNGDGGMFTVKFPREDMRNVDLWTQMMWYLTEVYKEEEDYYV